MIKAARKTRVDPVAKAIIFTNETGVKARREQTTGFRPGNREGRACLTGDYHVEWFETGSDLPREVAGTGL